MDIKLNDISSIKRELTAELSYDELTPHFEKAIAEYRKKATHPGFRKGKVPLEMVRKLYGDSIEYSALEDIATDIFRNYITENKIDLAGKGEIIDLDYDPKKNLKFKINFEVFPEVKIDNYKNLELKKTKYVIDDSLVDEEIQYHKFRNSGLELDGVASDNEYMITVDLQNLDEAGNILIGQSQKDLKIYLNNPGIYPEFKEAFKGIKEGETKIIDSKNAEGGDKKVQIKCKKVEKIIYPDLNEEFFKKITGKDDIKTEQEFRTEIKNELLNIYNSTSERQLRSDIVNEIIKLSDIELPDAYVNNILENMVEDYKSQNKKLPHDFKEDEFKKQRRVDAIITGKWFLIKEKLLELENIEVDESDYINIAEKYSPRYNIPADKLAEVYKENAEVKNQILNDKLLDKIIGYSKIEEVEELKKKEDNNSETG